MNGDNLFVHAKNAIAALSSTNGQAANEWLINFEVSAEAWNVANALLQEPAESSCQFYGANIFYNKITRDLR